MARQTVFTPPKSYHERIKLSDKTVEQLAEMSDDDILRLPFIGRRSLYTLRSDLAVDVSPKQNQLK